MGDVLAFFDWEHSANGPTEAINGIKAGLMGPFAGIGDTINWSTMKPLLIMLVLPLAESGSFLAPIIYAVLLAGITIAENYFCTHRLPHGNRGRRYHPGRRYDQQIHLLCVCTGYVHDGRPVRFHGQCIYDCTDPNLWLPPPLKPIKKITYQPIKI